jgi:general L-amino acid transport system permease protein
LEAVMISGTRLRGIALQVAALLGFCTLVIGAAITAWTRMQEQGMAYGFGVLMRPTEWDVSSILAEQTISDPYWWTLCVALANTILVSIVGIILATIVGFSIGVLRHAGNPLLSKVLGVYVETFRNIPLLLQLVFWYTTFTQLPPAREAISLGPDIWLANAGLYFPAFFLMGNGWLALVVMILGLALTVWGISVFLRRPRPEGIPRSLWRIGICLVAGMCFFLAMRLLLTSEAPELGRFNLTGGFVMPIELFALVFSITVFSSSYIAEVVRGGLQSVPKGLWEASDAMALSKSQAYVYVTLPVALRSILPSLGNQYVFVVKSTALGIAVGFSDIFSVSVVAITQTGQTIEFLAILMGIYLVLNYALTSVLNLANRRLSLTRR